MADFSPPFGSVGGNTRLPTIDERQEGFPCGPADQQLFNGLFRRLEAEMQGVFDGAGIAGDDTDDTILYQSILALIAAATGGSGDYVLMSQARTRLPIFPVAETADGTLGVITPATGQVRIPGSKTILHRGIFEITTTQTNLSTLASKTYHLRWNPTDGFALKDLSDSGYNPSALLETNAVFDSTYDDMLVARVTTNASNVVTVTNLINAINLSSQTARRDTAVMALDWTNMSGTSIALNWARTPKLADIALSEFRSNGTGPSGDVSPSQYGIARNLGVRLQTVTRYTIPAYQYYYEDSNAGRGTGEDGLVGVVITALAN